MHKFFTYTGIERVVRYACEIAAKRPRKMLANATKSNALRHSMVLWDEVAEKVAAKYPTVKYQKYYVDAIAALLPKDFKAGMENWGGDVYEHISDTNFGLLLHDMIQQKGAIVYATDLDGDRLTDLMADAPDVLRAWGQMVLDHAKTGKKMNDVWKEMGFTMTNGKDMTSVMYRMEGAPIYEQTLGSADAMLLRLLAGDETVGGTKDPYDPRIHFVLINEAYKAANPGKWVEMPRMPIPTGANVAGVDPELPLKEGADLRDVDLHGADLYGANLYRANLSRALNLSETRGTTKQQLAQAITK